MKDIEIKISRETRMVDLSKTTIGNDGENLQGNLVFSFVDEFVKGQGRLEYVINGESKYAFLLSDDENYYIPIKSVMTKEGQIDMQLVITEGTDASEIPIFKSNVFYVSCKKSINAEIEEELYAELFQMFNERVNAEYHPEMITYINKKYKGDYKKFAADVRKNSIFMSEAVFNEFLEKPDAKKLKQDLAYRAGMSFFDMYAKLTNSSKTILQDFN